MKILFTAYPIRDSYQPLFGKAMRITIYLSKSYRLKGETPKAKSIGASAAKFIVDKTLDLPNAATLLEEFNFELSPKDQARLREKYSEVCSMLREANDDSETWDWLTENPLHNFPKLWKKHKVKGVVL